MDPISPTPDGPSQPDRLGAAHPNLHIERLETASYDTAGIRSVGSDEDRRLQTDITTECLTRWWDDRAFDLVIVAAEFFIWGVPGFCRPRGIPFVAFGAGFIDAVAGGHLTGAVVDEMLGQLKMAARVIPCADHMGRRFAEFGFDRITPIPNGVDVDLFHPGPGDRQVADRLGIGADDIVFLHASHMAAIKRPADIVEAGAVALEANPDLLFLMVGGRTDAMRDEIETLCARRGIAERFRFPGWLPHDRMPDLYRLADVVVMPSSSEGLSNVFLEAQASGRVILTTDIPGAREVVEDGQTGVLFPAGDVQTLAAKILMLAGDPALRSDIGRRARDDVTRRHRLEDVIARYESAFLAVVEGGPEVDRREHSDPPRR